MHIYTLGYSGRTQVEFLNLLSENQIRKVIDIRKNPASQIEYFNKRHLETELSTRDIEYYFFGRELGNFYEDGFEAYTKTTDFKIALISLKEIAIKDKTAIMCFEKNPFECHRRFITQALEKEGWEITHIID